MPLSIDKRHSNTHTCHMTSQLIRVESPAIVEHIAATNHAPHSHTPYAASVTLADVVYFWAA